MFLLPHACAPPSAHVQTPQQTVQLPGTPLKALRCLAEAAPGQPAVAVGIGWQGLLLLLAGGSLRYSSNVR